MFLLVSFWPGTVAANSIAFLGDFSIAQTFLLPHPRQTSSRPWDKSGTVKEKTGPFSTEAEENFLTRWNDLTSFRGKMFLKKQETNFCLNEPWQKLYMRDVSEIQTLWKASTALTRAYWFLATASILQKLTFPQKTTAKNQIILWRIWT